MVFIGFDRFSVLRCSADVIIAIELAGWAAEDTLVLDDVLLDQQTEGVVRRGWLARVRVRVGSGVVTRLKFERGDDLTAIACRLDLVGLVLNSVVGRNSQARENRDDGDHNQQLNQSEAALHLLFHFM